MFNLDSLKPANEDELDFFEERAAICEHSGELTRKEAEAEARLCLLGYRRKEAAR